MRRTLSKKSGTYSTVKAANRRRSKPSFVDEDAKFTDYLNFFEFVAVLSKSRQLGKAGVEGLLGYYLDCLAKSARVRTYVANRENGYEELDRLLRERSGRK